MHCWAPNQGQPFTRRGLFPTSPQRESFNRQPQAYGADLLSRSAGMF